MTFVRISWTWIELIFGPTPSGKRFPCFFGSISTRMNDKVVGFHAQRLYWAFAETFFTLLRALGTFVVALAYGVVHAICRNSIRHHKYQIETGNGLLLERQKRQIGSDHHSESIRNKSRKPIFISPKDLQNEVFH